MKDRLSRLLMMAALIIVCGVSLAEAQSKVNLSGTWKMDPQKSKFQNGGPDAITVKFDHQESELTEALTLSGGGGDQTFEMKYTTDGKESEQDLGGQTIQAIAKWEGEALVIEWKMESNTFRRKLTVSADGKTMTMMVNQTGDNGEVNDTVVFDKQ